MCLNKANKVLLILGNGFDLALGLKTSYTSFIESDIFTKKVNLRSFPNAKFNEHDKNIHNYLIRRKWMNNWIDVEMELKSYASNQKVEYLYDDGKSLYTSNRSDGTIRASFTILCLDLQTYISSLDYSTISENSIPLELYRTIASHKQNDIVSFNYTDLKRLDRKPPKSNIEYIHGNVNEGIILGFQRFDDMAPGYEYMIKVENPNYKSCHLATKMMVADEIIIFGHSLGITDHYYFQQFFDKQTSEKATPKRMTLFTLNEKSKELIVRQLVSLSNGKYGLFRDNTEVTIIETENNDDVVKKYVIDLEKRMRRGILVGSSITH